MLISKLFFCLYPFSNTSLYYLLQPGTFDLVGNIIYEVDQQPFQTTFYNGTIEVTEPGGLLSVESVFLFCLGVALVGLLGFWIRDRIQNLSKVIRYYFLNDQSILYLYNRPQFLA